MRSRASRRWRYSSGSPASPRAAPPRGRRPRPPRRRRGSRRCRGRGGGRWRPPPPWAPRSASPGRCRSPRGFLHLPVHALADVVEEPGPPGQSGVQAELRRHDPGEVGHLDGVLEDVLAVAGAEVEPAQKLDEAGLQAHHPRLQGRLLPALVDEGLHLLLGLLHHLLNAARVDAAVLQELLQGHAGDLAADGVEGGEEDGVRGVVNDEVHPRQGLKGADVPPLPADDPPLHGVGGDGHHGHGELGRGLRGLALHGLGQDLLRLPPGLGRARSKAARTLWAFSSSSSRSRRSRTSLRASSGVRPATS